MATVRNLEIKDGGLARSQGDVKATVQLIEVNGERFIQVDTYGSADRQEIGKQSQSLRLSKTAFDQLVQLGFNHL